MNSRIYTITSPLHNEEAVADVSRTFLDSLGIAYDLRGNDFADYGSGPLDLIFVRTGGTEGIFTELLPRLLAQAKERRRRLRPFRLLASGQSNSLAASMEILSYLRQQGLRGEILHGSAATVSQRIRLLAQATEAREKLRGCRLGIIGKPSDWLISSTYDLESVRQKLGVELVEVDIEELLSNVSGTGDASDQIETALRQVVSSHRLQGFTLRCFDLLPTLHYTGCMALARLNADGLVAGCEGDVPALLSMMIVRAAVGVSGFQANPARIDTEQGEVLMAHCTIPLDMVEHYETDTHFESGIGIAVRGRMKEGPVTLFKTAGDLSRHFVAEGMLQRNLAEPGLCRTQQLIRLADKTQAAYFLTEPIGNHHIVAPGHIASLIEEILNV